MFASIFACVEMNSCVDKNTDEAFELWLDILIPTSVF